MTDTTKTSALKPKPQHGDAAQRRRLARLILTIEEQADKAHRMAGDFPEKLGDCIAGQIPFSKIRQPMAALDAHLRWTSKELLDVYRRLFDLADELGILDLEAIKNGRKARP